MKVTQNFTHEQQRVLDSWGHGLAIEAGAGCGKTTTLVAKCLQLLAKNPSAKFLAISFTERSAADFRLKLMHQIRSEMPELIESRNSEFMASVSTIHGFFAKVIREFSDYSEVLTGRERMLTELEANEIWRDSMINYLQSRDKFSHELLEWLTREGLRSAQNVLSRLKTISNFGVSLESLDPVVVNVLENVLKIYENKKLRLAVLDFNDLEVWAERLTQIADVRNSICERWDLVLIDEFQDTNPIQAKILERIVKPNFSNVVIVGDSKQSIYRFRDADVTVFQSWIDQLSERINLTLNFRSTSKLLSVINSTCEPCFREYELPYTALEEGQRLDLNQSDEASSVVYFETSNLNLDSPHSDWAEALTQLYLAGSLKDAVLLLRRLRGNESLFEALRKKQIPFVISGGGMFWDDPRVSELLLLLEWWSNPCDSLAGASLLRSPLVGISDIQLDLLIEKASIQKSTLWDVFWNPEFNNNFGNIENLKVFLRYSCRPGQLLYALLAFSKISEFNSNLSTSTFSNDSLPDAIESNEYDLILLRLWNMAESLSSQGYRFAEVVQRLKTSREACLRETEVPPPVVEGVLRIMTVHASKGLEFETVILADLQGPKRQPSAPRIFYDRSEGIYISQKDEKGERDQKSESEKRWRALERKKEAEESLRLFYVAMTRAKKRLFLCGNQSEESDEKGRLDTDQEGSVKVPDIKSEKLETSWQSWLLRSRKKNPEFFENLDSYLANNQKAKVENSFQVSNATEPNISPNNSPNNSMIKDTISSLGIQDSFRCKLNVDESKRRWSVSELIEDPNAYTSTQASSREFYPRFNLGNRTAAEWGTAAHLAICFQDKKSLLQLENDSLGRIHAATIQNELTKREIWGSSIENSLREFPFEVAVNKNEFTSEIVVGVIDYIALNPKNGLPIKIVDFKFLQSKISVQELKEKYQLQLEWYAWALSKLEPSLVGSFLELEILAFTGNDCVTYEWKVLIDSEFDQHKVKQAQLVFDSAKRRRPSPERRYIVHSSMGFAPMER